MNRNQTWTRNAAPGEVIYSEGFAGERVLFVIADGKVEISTRCEEKKVVTATLGRGELFGESALLGAEPRPGTAKALTFCKLTVVPATIVEDEFERVTPLLRHLVRTMIRRVKAKDDLLATYTHADFLPGVVSYANVLSLIAGGERAGKKGGWPRQGTPVGEASVALAEVVQQCRAMAGHSRPHVMAMLRRMEKLNLVVVELGGPPAPGGGEHGNGAAGRPVVTFDPVRIVERAGQMADHDLDVSINSELELIELADLEALIGVARTVLLDKLSHDEIADELFALRKSTVLNFVEQKGVAYFAKRARRGAGELQSLEDLLFVDQRTLFEAVNALDTYDLAKLLASLEDRSVHERLLSVMAEARKKEVAWIMRREIRGDPLEVEEIGQRLIGAVRELRARAA